jgi:hydroxyethylthiazole kinase-like uncharacterized protein yjeF
MPIPILSVAQMREWEKASWAAGRSEAEVIDKVGRAIARRLDSLVRPGSRILFLAGKGHNGDDVRAARKHLGSEHVALLLDVINPEQDLEKFLKATGGEGCSWVVDGLFGIGLDRPLDAHWQKLIEAVNAAKRPILAIDVPSGLNAATGCPEGAAIVADITLTVGAPKDGLLKAAQYVGRLEVLSDVGLVPNPFDTDLYWTTEIDFANAPPRRPVESNKGNFGHLAIFAGSFGFSPGIRVCPCCQPMPIDHGPTLARRPALAKILQRLAIRPGVGRSGSRGRFQRGNANPLAQDAPAGDCRCQRTRLVAARPYAAGRHSSR